ncbi:ATP-binding cassette domain-containing protein [Dellaglioa algida]|uniref:ABC-type uncharacterized transport system, ATPase component n=1 Tax=Dellaglioa algida DSM 15638 TaxID=1423719 RepID=A0A0R1HI05_9LACO|nr:ATP-binding cassette domain-containing protein [Dellaglioa algida]KRK46181.1 ABC-type uncharacterized transport system, ATPase component [Dellaglioa algida DSM 15638]MDK1732190.1 ATP-binding cassette domain-containing protein [Dellaglioa algida]MDK1733716.1 ATP-binding cassette domain-containing protein [Dellaglioa algida]
MTEPVFTLSDIVTTVNTGTSEEQQILKNLNLTINKGDFITVIGTNGAGKSTLFNTIAGNIKPASGQILLGTKNITSENDIKRTNYISRVFQDPKMGTAPRMTVAENLLLALNRGRRRKFKPRHLKQQIAKFQELTKQIPNGLSEHLNTPAGNLSGGQRQTLSFLMATLVQPDLLLLDEHTAALDPKTSQELLKLTAKIVEQEQLSCLMITHHLEDALSYGNRTIVLNDGQIQSDLSGEARANLSTTDLLTYFNDLE